MHLRQHPGAAAALLLTGVAVLHGLLGTGDRWPEAPATARSVTAPLPPAGSRARTELQRCQEHVTIIHDVHWAAACNANEEDDSVDCTLPEAPARQLNAARSAAEQQCLAEATAPERGRGGPPR